MSMCLFYILNLGKASFINGLICLMLCLIRIACVTKIKFCATFKLKIEPFEKVERPFKWCVIWMKT